MEVLVLVLLAIWTLGALFYAIAPWAWFRVGLAALFAAGVVALLAFPSTRRLVPWVVVGVFLVALAIFLMLRPSNERNWIEREAQTAWAEVEGDRLTVHNVRNFAYRTDTDFDPRWETRIYDLAGLRAVWFLVARFPELTFGAHTFVSFEFESGDYLAISIEARKEVGESYGILPGLYRRFETIYVAGDERDLVGLRTHVHANQVHLYRMHSTEPGRRAFLLDMVRRMNELRVEPDFYNTLLDTCTTGLRDHLNHVRDDPLPLTYEILVTGFSDRRAYEFELIDTTLPFEEARATHLIDASRVAIDAADFSSAIRAP